MKVREVTFWHPCNWCKSYYESKCEDDAQLIALILRHSICQRCCERHEAARSMVED